ncbi:MAG: hypothetical protein ABS942_08615 [Solibacillus sp.]
MTTSSSKQFYNDLKNYRQRVNTIIEKYKQRKTEELYIMSLQEEWQNLTQRQEALARENAMVNDQFVAVEKIIVQLLEPVFLEQIKQQYEPSTRLAETYLQQILIYLDALEISVQGESENNTFDQQRCKRIKLEIDNYCVEIEGFLAGSKEETQELMDLKSLKQDWCELKNHYEALMQEGFAANSAFQNATKAAEQVFHVMFLENLKNDDLSSIQLLETYLKQLNIYLKTVKLDLTKKNPKRPFLVDLWTWTLQKLEMLSVFYLIRNLFFPEYTKGNFRFVDAWLFGHTALAIIYVFIANVASVPNAFKYTFLVYGCLRMFEILIYQLNVILVHPYKTENYSLNSYRRMTIALIHNFIEIIFWFAGTFVTLQFITDSTVPLAVYTSFTHMVTYSMELDDSKWTVLAIFILQFQAVIGVFMTVLSLARFVSLFPQPASTDVKEQEANEVRHAKLMEEINYLKFAVENNSTRIAKNKQEIDQIQREGEHQHT